MTPLELILSKLPDAKKSGAGWSARCPAHDDRSPSLSISEGRDGRVLLHCHAGCTVDAICAAMNLKVSDLMPVNSVNVNGNTNSRRKKPIPLTANGKPTGKSFPTAESAVAELEARHGPSNLQWTYHDSHGDPVGVVVRWNRPDSEKTFRPVSRHGDGWRIVGMPEPRPLYGLPDLASAKRVYVCEGEKAADAVRSIGLTATTSPHGCESAGHADWRPLTGKEVIILPDNDSAGSKYANAVANILAELKPVPVVRIVNLPDLPEGGDAADFMEAHHGTDAADLRRMVERLADDAERLTVESSDDDPPALADPPEPYQPFPVDTLPEPLRSFVVAGAKAIGCDRSYIALPLLTAVAAAIGTTRRLAVKKLAWHAPAILWAAIVGESGTGKTPAFKLAMKATRERQQKAMERHAEALGEYEAALAHHEKTLARWKGDRQTSDDPPAKPKVPAAERHIVSDTTVEALALILSENPRGLLLARDELAGWIGSFDRYSGGGKRGADAAHWLSMHGGEKLTVDRKTGTPPTIEIPEAAVSICGGIQPAILHRALGTEHREDGLAARFLLTYPPRKPKRWTEDDISPEAEAEIARLINRLYDLQPTIDDDRRGPVLVYLTTAAKRAWITYYNSHNEEQDGLTGDLSAAWSKLEDYAARLALIFHFVRWAADDPTLESADQVDAASMTAAIELTEWFKRESRRVYTQLAESDDDRDRRRLVEWIGGKGGSVTAREVQMGCRWLRKPGDAESALKALATAGYGEWEHTPPGQRGQPTRRLRLAEKSTVNVNGIRNFQPEKTNTVDVDTVDGSESHKPDPLDDDGPDLLTVAAQLEAEGMPEGDSDAWGDA